jgi:hypothetical protein
LGERAQSAINYAFTWLGTHGDKLDARFVLPPLLGRMDLGERAQSAINHAFTWLSNHGTIPSADFVFNRILRKRDLPDSDWQRVATLAVGWLDSTPDNQRNRDHTLYSLLARPEKLTSEARDKVAEHSLNWLRNHSTEQSAERMPAALRKLCRTLPKNHHTVAEITSIIKAVLIRTDPERAYFRSLVQSLNRAAREISGQVDVALLEEGCVAVQSQANLSPASAGYAIPPLLVLGCRFGGKILEDVKNAVTPVLSDVRLDDSNRKRLVTACHRLLKAGAFPSREMAITLLRELDLEIERVV